jgi:phosphate transport system protein
MTKHFQRELSAVKERLLYIGDMVEQSVAVAVKAVQSKNVKLSEDVIARDETIDDLEVEFEDECLKALALYQPVAMDLRLIVACLKMNNDLERIGDLAVNIAHKVSDLAEYPNVVMESDFLSRMSTAAQAMLRKALSALVNLDIEAARDVLRSDDVIDDLNREIHIQMDAKIRADLANLRAYQLMVSVSRNLERIGDHATNIAEDVIYLIDGEIVRHGRGLRR